MTPFIFLGTFTLLCPLLRLRLLSYFSSTFNSVFIKLVIKVKLILGSPQKTLNRFIKISSKLSSVFLRERENKTKQKKVFHIDLLLQDNS